MKKSNILVIFITFGLIGILIYFLPNIYNSIQKYESNNIEIPNIEKKEEVKNEEKITINSEIVKNLSFPIMRNDKNKIESYYQLKSININNFSNNDLLYNAFLDMYEGYLVGHSSVGCTTNSKEFDATYLSSRIKNIIGRDVSYHFEDFTVPNLYQGSNYIGLWKYNSTNNTYVYYGTCNNDNSNITYYDYKKLFKVKTSKDNNVIYLYYYIGFLKLDNNHYTLYNDANMENEISSGTYDNIDNISIDINNLKTYKFTFKKGLCTYDNYCFSKGEWLNE